jgi:5-hydroxyisourate hydrolase-like protein (transthyretin family)
MKKSLFLGFCLLLLLSLGAAAQTDPGTLEGTVTDKDTGLPLAQVQVRLYNDEGRLGATFTDENGFYSFADLPADEYRLKFKLKEYKPLNVKKAVVEAGNTTVVDLALVPKKKKKARANPETEGMECQWRVYIDMDNNGVWNFINTIEVVKVGKGSYEFHGFGESGTLVKQGKKVTMEYNDPRDYVLKGRKETKDLMSGIGMRP